MRAAWAGLALVLASTFGAELRAEPAGGAALPRVLVVEAGSPELARKVRAEAAYAGFFVIGAEGDDARAEPSRSPPATIVIVSPERVEIRVRRADAADGDARFAQTLAERPGEGESFALRVVEALRARLVDVGWLLPSAPEPDLLPEPEPEPAPTTEVSADTAPATVASSPARPGDVVRGGLDAGLVASWSEGGLGVTPHARLALHAALGERQRLTVWGLLPLAQTELVADEGRARVAWSALAASFGLAWPLVERWRAGVGVGGGVFLLDARGDAGPGFAGRRERLLSGAYFAEVSLARPLAGPLALRGHVSAGFAAPRLSWRFDGREVGRLGGAFGSLGLSLELSWPLGGGGVAEATRVSQGAP